MADVALFLVLILAVASGWVLGRWQATRHGPAKQEVTRRPVSINYLIDEMPDAALNAFISALDVSAETLETHLALAAIHRRRGEVDRAIVIHQNLVDNEELRPTQRQHAQLELALDFYKAGLLDRAEAVLQRLIESSDLYRETALFMLLDIYQDERDWARAIQVSNLLAESLSPTKRNEIDRLRSHFYCELAELARTESDYLSARRALGKAQFYDSQNHRSILIEAELELELGNPGQAIAVLDGLVARKGAYPEGLLLVAARVFAAGNSTDAYHNWLERIYPRFPVAEILVELTRQKALLRGNDQATRFLLSELQGRPSFEGLAQLLSLCSDRAGELDGVLRALLQVSEAGQQSFQCQHCGFNGRQWHWRCPGCKHWDSLMPHRLLTESWS